VKTFIVNWSTSSKTRVESRLEISVFTRVLNSDGESNFSVSGEALFEFSAALDELKCQKNDNAIIKAMAAMIRTPVFIFSPMFQHLCHETPISGAQNTR